MIELLLIAQLESTSGTPTTIDLDRIRSDTAAIEYKNSSESDNNTDSQNIRGSGRLRG